MQIIEKRERVTLTEAIRRMNENYFVADISGNVVIAQETFDPNTNKRHLRYYNKTSLRNYFENQRVSVSKRGENVSMPVSDYWLSHPDRRTYDNIVFEPHSPAQRPFNIGRDYNLFRGFMVKPEAGECREFLRFVEQVICNRDAEAFSYVLDYMAHLIQCPKQLPGTAMVLRGEEGIGKGFFALQIAALVHPYSLHLTDSSSLTNRFNDVLQNQLVVIADETSVAGNKQAVNMLKGMITEPTLMIEPKYVKRFSIANYMRLIIISNEAHVVQASTTDRRYLVLNVSSARRNDHAYFAQLHKTMQNGGREALMHYLLHRDISNSNLRKVPQTEGLFEQKLLSMSPMQHWLYDRLTEGVLPSGGTDWPDWVAKQDVYDDYLLYSRRTGERTHAGATELGSFIHAVFGGQLRVQKRTVRDGKRPNGYLLPDLATCRELFDKHMNMQCNWPQGE